MAFLHLAKNKPHSLKAVLSSDLTCCGFWTRLQQYAAELQRYTGEPTFKNVLNLSCGLVLNSHLTS